MYLVRSIGKFFRGKRNSRAFRSGPLAYVLAFHQGLNFFERDLSLEVDVGVEPLTAKRATVLLFIDAFERDKRTAFGADPLSR